MVSKYWLIMKSGDGRILAHYSNGVITNQASQDSADAEAMEALGLRLMTEAEALRRKQNANMGVA